MVASGLPDITSAPRYGMGRIVIRVMLQALFINKYVIYPKFSGYYIVLAVTGTSGRFDFQKGVLL